MWDLQRWMTSGKATSDMPLSAAKFFTLAIRSPAVWIGALIGVAALCAWAYQTIDSRAVARCEGKHAIALAGHIQRAQAQATEIALQDAEISESYEVWRTRTVTKVEEVTREVPADCAACRISPVGLSLINAARGGGLPMAENPGQPDVALPTPPAAPNRGDAGTGGRSLDGRPGLLRLQGETLSADTGRQGEGI